MELRLSQTKRFYEYLKDKTATASMAASDLRIAQKNLTRYKRELELKGLLWEVEEKPCKKTGFKAYYLTTNPKLIPPTSQLNLF